MGTEYISKNKDNINIPLNIEGRYLLLLVLEIPGEVNEAVKI